MFCCADFTDKDFSAEPKGHSVCIGVTDLVDKNFGAKPKSSTGALNTVGGSQFCCADVVDTDLGAEPKSSKEAPSCSVVQTSLSRTLEQIPRPLRGHTAQQKQ